MACKLTHTVCTLCALATPACAVPPLRPLPRPRPRPHRHPSPLPRPSPHPLTRLSPRALPHPNPHPLARPSPRPLPLPCGSTATLGRAMAIVLQCCCCTPPPQSITGKKGNHCGGADPLACHPPPCSSPTACLLPPLLTRPPSLCKQQGTGYAHRHFNRGGWHQPCICAPQAIV